MQQKPSFLTLASIYQEIRDIGSKLSRLSALGAGHKDVHNPNQLISSSLDRPPSVDPLSAMCNESLPSSHPTAPLVFIPYDVATEEPRLGAFAGSFYGEGKLRDAVACQPQAIFPDQNLSNFPKKDIETDHILQMCNKTTNGLNRAFPVCGNSSHDSRARALHGQAICSEMLENRQLNRAARLCGLGSLLNP